MILLRLISIAALTAAPFPTPMEDSKILTAYGAGAKGEAPYRHQKSQTVSKIMNAGFKLFGSGAKLKTTRKGTLYGESLAGSSIMHHTVTGTPSFTGDGPSMYRRGVRVDYVPSSLRRPKPDTIYDKMSSKLRDVKREMRKVKGKIKALKGMSKGNRGAETII
jgi:hypothetical protein